MEKAIKKFQKVTNRRPERIFFYRDAVGDKQLKTVSEVEVSQIKSALATCDLKNVAIVYINVCKRVNTRLFAQGEIENSYKNPIPGIVANSAITDCG